jgi:hypothetical protein
MGDKPVLYLDDGVVLNLYATGRLPDILRELPYHSTITTYTQTTVLYLTPETDAEGTQLREALVLEDLIHAGLLAVAPTQAVDDAVAVPLSREVDDATATLIALAGCCEAHLATDDPVTRRLMHTHFPTIRLVSTLELLKTWNDVRADDSVTMTMLIQRSIQRAAFTPSQDDPCYRWWLALLQTEQHPA